MALRDPPAETRTHVAAYVGTRTHALIAGEAVPEPPPLVKFDKTTPTIGHATRQADMLAEAAADLLTRERWTILDAELPVGVGEVTGTLDLIVANADGRRAVLDVKTGWHPGPAAWLQVGSYLALLHENPQPEWGGILHVPRVAVRQEPDVTLALRERRQLVREWLHRYERIRIVLDGARPMPTPGAHCRRCRVADCPVRA